MVALENLITTIQQVYLHPERYEMIKHIVDFHSAAGEYIGDYFNLYIQERVESAPPKMYHIGGPFDLISKKAPQRVVGFQGGELFINRDITQEINQRTAAMNFVVLRALGYNQIYDKRICIVGTGHVAKECLMQLHEFDPALHAIDYVTTSGSNMAFEALGGDIGITCHAAHLTSLAEYDIIILHTSSRTPIITRELFGTVKQGACIFSFISSQPLGEIEGAVYTDDVSVIVDRDQTLLQAVEIQKQIESGILSKQNVVTLYELLSREKTVSSRKATIYRSTGAPMQSLAIVSLLE